MLDWLPWLTITSTSGIQINKIAGACSFPFFPNYLLAVIFAAISYTTFIWLITMVLTSPLMTYWYNALHTTSRGNRLNTVQSLIRHGADVNAPGVWGQTPLLFASVQGRLEAVLCLLEHSADVNAKDKDDDWTSLHLAAAMGHFEIAWTLLKNNADTASQDNAGHTVTDT